MSKYLVTKEYRKNIYDYIQELLGRDLIEIELSKLSNMLKELQKEQKNAVLKYLPESTTCELCGDKFRSLNDILSIYTCNKCVYCSKAK